MKKITVMLIALVLICSSAFAAFSVTAGGGFGLNTTLGETEVYDMGSAGFFGVDFILDNGLTFYNDVEFYFALRNQDGKIEDFKGLFPIVCDKTGIGYTFGGKVVSVMVGAGPEVQMLKSGGDYTFRLGVDTRIKSTLYFSKNCGVTFQIDPAFEVLTLKFDNEDASTFSTGAIIGITLTY